MNARAFVSRTALTISTVVPFSLLATNPAVAAERLVLCEEFTATW